MVLASTSSGCSNATTSEKLRDTVLHFNDNVRWQRYRDAARALPPRRRAAWVTAMSRFGQVVSIDEYDMRPVEVGEDFAVIEVDLAYHRHDDLKVHREKRQQMWWLVDGAWMLKSDEKVILDESKLPDRFPELTAPRTKGPSGPKTRP
jgi:hypothetical protein